MIVRMGSYRPQGKVPSAAADGGRVVSGSARREPAGQRGWRRLSPSWRRPHEFAPFLEDTAANEDPLDIAWLCIEDYLAYLVNAWSKVEGIRIEHNDVSLLAGSKRANLGLHIEDLSPTDGGQLQRGSHRWVDRGVLRQRAL